MKFNEKMVNLLHDINANGINAGEEVTVDFFRAVKALRDSGNQRLNLYDISSNVSYVSDLVNDIRKAGIKEFTVSESSTALMKIIEALVENGCSISGMTRVNDEFSYFDEETPKTIPALLFKVNE